jgi:hypothetical protein
MNVKCLLYAVAAFFLAASSAQANMVQISFSGTIAEVADFGATVFNGTAHVGDAVSGALVLDYSRAAGVSQGNGLYSDPSGKTYWITNSWLTVSGVTYSSNSIAGYTHNYAWDKASTTGGKLSTSPTIYSHKVGNTDNDTSRYDNLIGISGQYKIPFNGNISLAGLAALISQANSQNTRFEFKQGRALSPSGYWGTDNATVPPDGTVLEDAFLVGSVSKIKITNLAPNPSQVPLPASIGLLGPVLAGLGCFVRKQPRLELG